MREYTTNDGVRIHYLVRDGDGPPIVLLHGLTANARYFDGLIAAGLCARETIAIDLRGRGQSDKPESGYTLADHAADVLAVLDRRGIERAVVCGHSYGGLLALYLAANHAERVERLVVIDIAGPSVHNPAVFELIKPSLDRLGTTWPSLDDYLDAMAATPALACAWDAAIEAYFRADVEILPDRRARVRTPPDVIAQVIAEAQREDWPAIIAAVTHPTLFLHARGPFGPPGTPPIVLDEQASDFVDSLGDGCTYEIVPGNHMTMLFGAGAIASERAIRAHV